MTEKFALLDTIRESPGDDAPRLIYADWLDEHELEGLAQMIRLCLKEPHRESKVCELVDSYGENRVGYVCLAQGGTARQAVADVLRAAPFDLFGTCDLFSVTVETFAHVGHKVILEYKQSAI